MEENYSYPLDIEWSQNEMLRVMAMWQALEEVYEKGLIVDNFNEVYREFKQVIKSIGEERQLGRDFEAVSGYSLYRAVQESKQLTAGQKLKLKK